MRTMALSVVSSLRVQATSATLGSLPAAIREHIREIQPAAGFEQALYAPQHRRLVRRKIDHAVGDDDIEAARREIEPVQPFYIALEEAHVVEAEHFGVMGLVFLRDGQLFVGHIHADELVLWPHKLCQHIDIAPGPAAQIQHPAAFQQQRTNQPRAN